MSRQLLLGIAAAAALGAAISTDAVAGPFHPAGGSSQQVEGFTQRGHAPAGPAYDDNDGFRNAQHAQWHGGYEGRHHWRGERWGGRHRGYDPGHGFYGRQRCTVRNVRYWDGWGWVVDRRQVCN